MPEQHPESLLALVARLRPTQHRCPQCGGSGRTLRGTDVCGHCRGTGHIAESDTKRLLDAVEVLARAVDTRAKADDTINSCARCMLRQMRGGYACSQHEDLDTADRDAHAAAFALLRGDANA